MRRGPLQLGALELCPGRPGGCDDNDQQSPKTSNVLINNDYNAFSMQVGKIITCKFTKEILIFRAMKKLVMQTAISSNV